MVRVLSNILKKSWQPLNRSLLRLQLDPQHASAECFSQSQFASIPSYCQEKRKRGFRCHINFDNNYMDVEGHFEHAVNRCNNGNISSGNKSSFYAYNGRDKRQKHRAEFSTSSTPMYERMSQRVVRCKMPLCWGRYTQSVYRQEQRNIHIWYSSSCRDLYVFFLACSCPSSLTCVSYS